MTDDQSKEPTGDKKETIRGDDPADNRNNRNSNDNRQRHGRGNRNRYRHRKNNNNNTKSNDTDSSSDSSYKDNNKKRRSNYKRPQEENKGDRPSNQRPRRSNRYNKNRNPRENNRDQSSARSNPQRRRRNNRRKSPKIKLDPIFREYEKLREAMVQARIKYFDLFHTTNERLKNKIENNYFVAIKKLREFEQDLSLEDRHKFEAMYPSKPDDLTYTLNHNLKDIKVNSLEDNQIEDPHLLETQKQAKFKEDEEESVGTMEDYLAYKGTSQVLRDQNIDKILKKPINTLES